jgi:hypothetical protein
LRNVLDGGLEAIVSLPRGGTVVATGRPRGALFAAI